MTELYFGCFDKKEDIELHSLSFKSSIKDIKVDVSTSLVLILSFEGNLYLMYPIKLSFSSLDHSLSSPICLTDLPGPYFQKRISIIHVDDTGIKVLIDRDGNCYIWDYDTIKINKPTIISLRTKSIFSIACYQRKLYFLEIKFKEEKLFSLDYPYLILKEEATFSSFNFNRLLGSTNSEGKLCLIAENTIRFVNLSLEKEIKSYLDVKVPSKIIDIYENNEELILLCQDGKYYHLYASEVKEIPLETLEAYELDSPRTRTFSFHTEKNVSCSLSDSFNYNLFILTPYGRKLKSGKVNIKKDGRDILKEVKHCSMGETFFLLY